jgi:hypothetical protein
LISRNFGRFKLRPTDAEKGRKKISLKRSPAQDTLAADLWLRISSESGKNESVGRR